MEIRELRPEEYQRAGAVTAAAYSEYEQIYAETSWWAHYMEDLAAVRARVEHATVLAAIDDDGGILGTVTIEFELATDGTPRDPHSAHLRMLAVDPAIRRRGIARALLGESLALIKERGKRYVTLPTTPHMRAGHPLYESFGFVRDPDNDLWEDGELVLMGYRLDLE